MAIVQDTHACSVCRRHFLAGEAVRLYREPGSRALQRVCPLCRDAAVKRGWEIVEATRDLPLRVPADPVRYEAAHQRDRLVERLQQQLDQAQVELSALSGSLEQSQQRNEALELDRQQLHSVSSIAAQRESALKATERARDEALREITRLQAALAQAEMNDRRRERAERRVRELEGELEDAGTERERLMRARRRESDHGYLREVAAEAFNRSALSDAIAGFARTWGPPRCRIEVDGVSLPRRIVVTFAWPRAWQQYVVLVDLVDRTARVDEIGGGDDPGEAAAAMRSANASWTPANGLIAG